MVSLRKENTTVLKTATGRWGAFSYDLEILDKKDGLKYLRTYKGMALSNLFFDFDKLKTASEIFVSIPNGNATDNQVGFYYVAIKKVNSVSSFLNMISYMLTNQIFIFITPILLSFVLCNDEYKKSYAYQSKFHKLAIISSKYIIAVFILLIALY